MNEIEEELITFERNRNPKVVLAFLSIIILIAAILLGITLSDSSDSSTNSVTNETPPTQAQVVPDEQNSIEIDENVVLSPLEKGKVTILGDPIPVDSEIGYLAPSFKAQLNTGSEPITIDPADGTVRLIGFFAHWCPHCQK